MLTAFGAVALAAGTWALASGTPALGGGLVVGCFVIGPLFLGIGAWGLSVGASLPLLSRSLNLLQSGKLADAEAILDTLGSPRSQPIRAAIILQRAMIAVRRGDLEGARRALDGLASTKKGLFESPGVEVARAEALGLRAWVRAAAGLAEGAEQDIAATRALLPSAGALAHATLAEAVLLQRSADRPALTGLLQREGGFLLAALEPRERAVVRAMKRMLRAPVESVYRTQNSAKDTDDRAEPPLGEWMNRVAPDLAAFAPAIPDLPKSASRQPPAELTAPPGAVARLPKPPNRFFSASWKRVIALWLLLIALFVAIWQLLAIPPRSAPPHRGAPVATSPAPSPRQAPSATVYPRRVTIPVTLLLLGGMAVALTLAMRKSYAQTRKLQRLSVAVLQDRDVAAELAETAAERAPLTAANAELLRSTVADRRADIAGALEHVDAARAKLVTEQARIAAAPYIAPMIASARAYALAALQRPEEAAAELSTLPPDYLALDRMRFVVPLVAFLAEGDLENAASLVDVTSPDLAVGHRDELVRELVRAAVSPDRVGAAEIARLRDELADRARDRLWIQRVMPDLVERFDEVAQGK